MSAIFEVSTLQKPRSEALARPGEQVSEGTGVAVGRAAKDVVE